MNNKLLYILIIYSFCICLVSDSLNSNFKSIHRIQSSEYADSLQNGSHETDNSDASAEKRTDYSVLIGGGISVAVFIGGVYLYKRRRKK